MTESVTTEISESSERIVHLMVNTISPILLDTIIKGKTRIHIHTWYHAYRTIQMIMLIVVPYTVLLIKDICVHLPPGDSRVQEANIIWVEPQAACWIQNPDTEQKGELALEITMDIISTGESGGAWGTAMDACIPVMDLIDTTRSVPYSIQQVQQVCGISYAFSRVTQVQQVLYFLPL
jgi:hypothetical protein